MQMCKPKAAAAIRGLTETAGDVSRRRDCIAKSVVEQLNWGSQITASSLHAYSFGALNEPVTFACSLGAGMLKAAIYDTKHRLRQIAGVRLGPDEDEAVCFSVPDQAASAERQLSGPVEVRLVIVRGGTCATDREMYSEVLLGWLFERQKVPAAFQEAAYALKLVAEAWSWIGPVGAGAASAAGAEVPFTPKAFVFFLAALTRQISTPPQLFNADLMLRLLLMMRDFCWESYEIEISLQRIFPSAGTNNKMVQERFTIGAKQTAEATAARLTLNDVNLTANVTRSFLDRFARDLRWLVDPQGHTAAAVS